MPRYEEYDTEGTLLRRVISDDDGNVIEEWPEPDHSD